jgi:hypothetical protein
MRSVPKTGQENKATDDKDIEFANAGTFPPAIPDGDQYEVSFVRCEQARLWGSDKLFLHFKMLTSGPWQGELFWMSCKVIRNGRWTPGSKFYAMWTLANGKRPARTDRMSTRIFRNKIFRAKFYTVTSDSDQKARPPALHYSVIKELLEVKAGGPCS